MKSLELYLPKTANELDRCLQDFQEYTNQQKMKINSEKTKLMLFNMSQKFRFPLEISLSNYENFENYRKYQNLEDTYFK